MKNVIAAVLLFVVVSIAIFIGISSLGTIHSTTIGDCTVNATGSLVNCSYSDADFYMINNTATKSNQIFTTLSTIEWLIVLAIFIAVMLFVLSLARKK